MLKQKEDQTVNKLLIGRIATNIADSFFYMAILWFFKKQFNSPMILSLLFIADSSIDMVAFIFGPLIDRIYIKKLLKSVTILQMILSFFAVAFFIVKIKAIIIITILLLVYLASTIGSTLIYPAEEKILPLVVSKQKLIKVNGIFQMTYRTLDLFLDALATALITFLSIKATMIISILVFGIALIFYSQLYLPKKLQINHDSEYFTENYLQDLIKGWQTLKSEGRILFLIIPFAITNLFYGISSVGLPYFASHYLNSSAIGYGGLEMASSIGGLLGSLLIQRFSFGKQKLEFFITLSLFFAGIVIITETTIFRSIPFLILMMAGTSSLWISMMNINFEVLVQESFSSHILGRIETINSSIINCMIPVGSFLGGIIVQKYNASCTILLEGIAYVLTALAYLLIFNQNK